MADALNIETIKSMTANMTSLKQSAASGGFAITESGADAYIQAINNALDSLGSMMFNVQILNQETKLGTSPDAIAMSRYNLENVQGGPGTIGLLPAIQELIKALTEAREAMEQAKQNYQSVDQSNQMNYPQ
ncbi:hypothetical protein [Actinosynnema pretiosum]|uniref:hypothetical protein n=1 Tax=Actinosynnema pretiosum TaxID=42197 RepID=UPI001E492FAF|nr:hypothetical protein [Actinosynnema pretiosum]